MSFLFELRRRNVYRAGAAYAVSAWLIIQVAETVFPAFGIPDSVIRAIVIVLAAGFIPALILAWIFELTPGGLVPESQLDRASSQYQQNTRNLDRAIIFVLLLALGFFLFDRFILAPGREAEIAETARMEGIEQAQAEAAAVRKSTSLVVLPFADLSPDSNYRYLADGLAEELTTRLTKVKGLRVISRTSAFAFRDRAVSTAEIAETLDVSYVLEGSVRVSGDRLRVTAQLVDAHDDNHLWANNYDRDFSDVFAIQDEITALIQRDIDLAADTELPPLQRIDPEAYRYYLQALQAPGDSVDQLTERRALLEQALEIDPSFAVGWARLGIIDFYQYANYEEYGWEYVERARESALKALRLDPYCALAHALLGAMATFDNELDQAAEHLSRAMELDPANPAVGARSMGLLQSLGRFDESIQLAEFILRQDPYSGIAHASLALNLLMDRQVAASQGQWREALQLAPDGPEFVPLFLAFSLGFDGKIEAAREVIAGTEHFYNEVGLMWLDKLQGREEDFRRRMAWFQEIESELDPSRAASVYALLGDADAAFERLDRVEDFYHWNRERYWPLYWPIVEDPRWAAFLERAGVSQAHLDAVEFDFKFPTFD